MIEHLICGEYPGEDTIKILSGILRTKDIKKNSFKINSFRWCNLNNVNIN